MTVPDPAGERVGASGSAAFLTVRVGERRYALPAALVREIVRLPPMTRVPQSPPALLGIANLRGSVLPVVSLRGLVAMAEQSGSASARAIVLDLGTAVAVVVDVVDALLTVDSTRIQTTQASLGMEEGERVEGVFETDDGRETVKVLDIAGLLGAAFARRPAPNRQSRRLVGAAAVDQRSAVPVDLQTLVTFDVAGQEFALDLSVVAEVLQMPATRGAVPRTDAPVLGIVSRRGRLLPLLSLRGLLGFPIGAEREEPEKVVVMRFAGTEVGLVADRAVAVLSADPGLIDAVPAVLSARLGGEARLRGIYRAEGGRRLVSVLAPEQLFREDVIKRLSENSRESRMSTSPIAASSTNELTVVVFRLGSDEYALPIAAVEEIANVPAGIRRVPKTPKFLEGVVNLRGSVLPVIDQRRRFDMPPAGELEGRRLIVIRTDRHRAGLIVDSVSDVLRIPSDVVEPAPELTDDITRLVRGVVNLEQSARIILLLDSAELLTRAERGLLEKFEVEAKQASA